ncbi:MAG: metallophosphoesterase [Pseudomonadota bacterium]
MMTDIIEIEGNSQGRDFVSTDPHGSLNEMRQVIALLRGGDRLFLCGDYVDRGKDSLGLIRYLKKNQQQGKLIFMIRGNHEDMMLETLQDIELMLAMSKGTDLFGGWRVWQAYCAQKEIQVAYPWCQSLDKTECKNILKSYRALRRLYCLQHDAFLRENYQEDDCYTGQIRDYLNDIKDKYSFFSRLDDRVNNKQAWVFSLRQAECAEVKAFIAHDQMPYGIRVKEAQQGEKTIKPFDLFHAAPLSDERICGVLSGVALTEEERECVTWARPTGCWHPGSVRMVVGDILPKSHRTYLGHSVNGSFLGREVYKEIQAFNLDVGTADSQCILAYDHTNDRIHLFGKREAPVLRVIACLLELANTIPSCTYPEDSRSAQKLYDQICQEVWRPHFSLSQFKQDIRKKILDKKIEDEITQEQRIGLAYFLLTTSNILSQEQTSYRKRAYSNETRSMLSVVDTLLGGIEHHVVICDLFFKKQITFFGDPENKHVAHRIAIGKSNRY